MVSLLDILVLTFEWLYNNLYDYFAFFCGMYVTIQAVDKAIDMADECTDSEDEFVECLEELEAIAPLAVPEVFINGSVAVQAKAEALGSARGPMEYNRHKDKFQKVDASSSSNKHKEDSFSPVGNKQIFSDFKAREINRQFHKDVQTGNSTSVDSNNCVKESKVEPDITREEINVVKVKPLAESQKSVFRSLLPLKKQDNFGKFLHFFMILSCR